MRIFGFGSKYILSATVMLKSLLYKKIAQKYFYPGWNYPQGVETKETRFKSLKASTVHHTYDPFISAKKHRYFIPS